MVHLHSLRRVGALSFAYILTRKLLETSQSDEKVFKLNLSEDYSEDRSKVKSLEVPVGKSCSERN